jgi:hypothetical protein
MHGTAMRIVHVIPNMESKEMLMCEMWMVKGPTPDPVPVWGYPEEEWHVLK